MRRRISPRGEGGQTIVIVAFALPVLLLVAALLIDVTGLFVHKRSLQNRADAVSLAASQEVNHTTGTCTGSCVTTLNAYNKKNDPEAEDLVPCLVDSQTNCYEAPYTDENHNPHIGQIEVRLKDNVNLALGGVAGILSQDVSARSVAGVTVPQVVTPGTTSTISTPPVVITTGGHNLVFFAGSKACDAISATNQAPQVAPAAMWSNGGYSFDPAKNGTGTLYISSDVPDGPPPAGEMNCVKLGSDNNWTSDSPIDHDPAPSDPAQWPIPMPPPISLNGACHNAASIPKTLTVDSGFPGAANPPGIYCATDQIKFSGAGTYTGYTWVVTGDKCSNQAFDIPHKDNIFVGSTLSNGRKVIFYTPCKVDVAVKISDASTWTGDIYAPYGQVSFTGGGKPFDGYIQADTIKLTGGGSQYTGEGPIEGQTTTTIPGTTTVITTPATTTEGTPSYGLDE